MAKVVQKALGLLTLLAEEPDRPLSLDEVMQRSGIARPTCARLLEDLRAAGYAEHVPKRRGYRLGPMSFQMSRRTNYRHGLIDVAEPILRRCADAAEASVTLSTLHRRRRYVLLHINGNPGFEIKTDRPYFEDLYDTPTGRVLLAHTASSEVDAYIKAHGMPRQRWKGIRTRRALDQALGEVRRRGHDVDNYGDKMTIVAYPVWDGDLVVAAIGAAVPLGQFVKPRSEVIQRAAAQAARELSEQLSARQPPSIRRPRPAGPRVAR